MMSNRDGMVIYDWMIDEIHYGDVDIPSYHPTTIIPKWKGDLKAYFKLDEDMTVRLTKCIDCRYCIKPRDGNYRCKYSIHDGKPERETCNYERKKR